MTWRAAIAAAPASISGRSGAAVGLGAAPRPLGGQPDPASSPTSFAAAVNGTAAAARPVILARPGDIVAPATPSSASRGARPRPHSSAVVPGPAQRDRAEHGVNGLVPVGDELRLVPGPAPRLARPAVAGVGGQQRFQHRASQLHDRGADRQLGGLDARAAGQGCRDAVAASCVTSAAASAASRPAS